MTGDALWWLVMVLAVVCTVLAVMLLRKPRVGPPGPGAGKPDAAAILARQGAAKSAAVSAGTASVANAARPSNAWSGAMSADCTPWSSYRSIDIPSRVVPAPSPQ